MIYEKLLATSHAQVLRFLAHNMGQSFYEREIVESTGVSRSAVNLAANALYEAGFLKRERPVQPVIVSNQELATMKQNDRAFYEQVQQGIVLWEAVDELAT